LGVAGKVAKRAFWKIASFSASNTVWPCASVDKKPFRKTSGDLCWFQISELTKLAYEVNDLIVAKHRRPARAVSQLQPPSSCAQVLIVGKPTIHDFTRRIITNEDTNG
jgi:hypothetical protein